jgi:hypothetical protein
MMNLQILFNCCRRATRPAVLCFVTPLLALAIVAYGADELIIAPAPSPLGALQPGETLTYDISWSNLISAGTAVLEVKNETLPDGRQGPEVSGYGPLHGRGG